MGADDEKIDFAHRDLIRRMIRDEHKISDNEFLIVTGGKIDSKKKIDMLMQAVNKKEGVKLLVFGKADDDFLNQFTSSINDNVIYVGWIQSDQVYNYFFCR